MSDHHRRWHTSAIFTAGEEVSDRPHAMSVARKAFADSRKKDGADIAKMNKRLAGIVEGQGIFSRSKAQGVIAIAEAVQAPTRALTSARCWTRSATHVCNSPTRNAS